METMELPVCALKSPVRKLMRFFQRSRDSWKAKYHAVKDEYRLLGNQLRAVEKSRQKWKEDARQAEEQLRQLQKELEQYKKSVAA